MKNSKQFRYRLISKGTDSFGTLHALLWDNRLGEEVQTEFSEGEHYQLLVLLNEVIK